MSRTVKVGTRGSAFALAQTDLVLKKLRLAHPDVKFVPIVLRTKGDSLRVRNEFEILDKGLFVKEFDRALMGRKIDIAIHRAKDLPIELLPEISIGAVLEREDASDVFVGRRVATMDKLSPGAQIGVSGLRRMAFLRAQCPQLEPVEFPGDLKARLEKLNHPKSKLSGLITSGVRFRWVHPQNNTPAEILPKDQFVPSAGQAAPVVTVRMKDEGMKELLALIHHVPSAAAIETERAILRRLMGSRPFPIGIHADVTDDGLVQATAALATSEGENYVRETATGSVDDISYVAEALETLLKSRGAAEILVPSGNGHRSRQKVRR